MAQPKTVIVASTNPVKVEVARRAFAAVFSQEEFVFKEVKSQSGVPDQPIGEQTREGAKNRLAFIQQEYPDAHFWISQEGGLFKEAGRLYNRAWIMVTDQTGFVAESSTAQFYLPKKSLNILIKVLSLAMQMINSLEAQTQNKAWGQSGILPTILLVELSIIYKQLLLLFQN